MTQKYKIFLVMVVSMILGYLPWYNFSAVMSYIVQDFGLTSDQTGIILSAFQGGYVVVVILTGWLADKIGEKKVVAWATLSTAIFSTLFAFLSKGFWSILILRLLTGLSAGAIYVPGMAFLSKWFPPGERGKVIGAYTGALTLAYGGGYFIAAPLAAAYSWEIGILATSLPAFLASYLVFRLVEEPQEPYLDDNRAKDQGIELTDGQVKTDRDRPKPAPDGGYTGPVVISCGYMGHMWELYAFWGWIGPFMSACALQAGYEGGEALTIGGRLAALIIVSGAPAVYLMGIAADKWGRSITIFICSILSLLGQFLFGFLYGHSLTLVTIVGFWIGFWVIADSGIYKAGLTEMVTYKIRGTALGIQSAAGYLMTVISPYIFGLIVNYRNTGVDDPMYAENWALPFIVLGSGALLAPLSAVVLRRIKQAKLMAEGKY
ncbi:MFS transporter [Natranaerobius thermophilus]|uniref:Major facilitator superfamily MFS_1 n=1 Tax=Natranaerobius thermophilus (strain ATCC BAA-1301 / DSM 18059 / JW/NM-WN-LF) TaxID=457570 RepID=B2A2C5_NATTJ|nr:MFS transporter [Natranaerobius thermophilus]ACB86231.1 major facilitator superfamily MFS_1 [Natranaerobius thermophilus JW/NM-WN-LF]